ncbi:MAG: SDR family oxidoreductase [Nitrospirota bacterium]
MSRKNTAEELFDKILGTNICSNDFTVQKALPLFTEDKAIVCTTSWLDQVGVEGTSPVSPSKAALRSLIRTLSARRDRDSAFRQAWVATEDGGRIGEGPSGAVTFPASSDASDIPGIELAVDGGRTQL